MHKIYEKLENSEEIELNDAYTTKLFLVTPKTSSNLEVLEISSKLVFSLVNRYPNLNEYQVSVLLIHAFKKY